MNADPREPLDLDAWNEGEPAEEEDLLFDLTDDEIEAALWQAQQEKRL